MAQGGGVSYNFNRVQFCLTTTIRTEKSRDYKSEKMAQSRTSKGNVKQVISIYMWSIDKQQAEAIAGNWTI